ncbi:Mediator of RNA polymerase II transcription subunit 20 [Spathaspora sp. JA1]|nr:Mediator of RNA polymerase II transcription subunit 20 [Spathaspora sp. JA1]
MSRKYLVLRVNNNREGEVNNRQVTMVTANNPYSIAPGSTESTTTDDSQQFLFTLTPSYLPDSTITLINNKSSGVFTNLIEEEASELGHPPELLTIPDPHLHRGATTGLNDNFDLFIGQKLQSLWLQRQLIKGDGGQIYELENGNLCIKTSNVFLHGNFRGFLIQIDLNDHLCDLENPKSFRKVFEGVCEKYGIPAGNLCCDVLDVNWLDKYGDLCFQYSKILNF